MLLEGFMQLVPGQPGLNTSFRCNHLEFDICEQHCRQGCQRKPGSPTEGGAFHAEGKLRRRFTIHALSITALCWGCHHDYQAIAQIDGSIFLGNSAKGQGNLGGYGGAISGSSNDTSADGSTNRRSAYLSIVNSYIQGRYGSTTTAVTVVVEY